MSSGLCHNAMYTNRQHGAWRPTFSSRRLVGWLVARRPITWAENHVACKQTRNSAKMLALLLSRIVCSDISTSISGSYRANAPNAIRLGSLRDCLPFISLSDMLATSTADPPIRARWPCTFFQIIRLLSCRAARAKPFEDNSASFVVYRCQANRPGARNGGRWNQTQCHTGFCGSL